MYRSERSRVLLAKERSVQKAVQKNSNEVFFTLVSLLLVAMHREICVPEFEFSSPSLLSHSLALVSFSPSLFKLRHVHNFSQVHQATTQSLDQWPSLSFPRESRSSFSRKKKASGGVNLRSRFIVAPRTS